jgi:hypothetical protein
MPYGDPNQTDPMMLVGVELPASASTARETAGVFAEEFVRLGYTEAMLMYLFQNPHYVGAHQAYRALGEDAVRAIIREHATVWGRVSFRDVDSASPADVVDGDALILE